MPLTRTQKETRVKATTEAVEKATSLVFMSYDALSVNDVEELRGKLFEQGVRLKVMPKRLLKIVMKNVKLDFDPTAQPGQLALLWGDDPVAPAKILYAFARTHENVQLVAGVLEGETVSAEEITKLAQLPGREQLLAQLVGTLAAPIGGFARVLSGVQRQTVYVLKAIAESKQA